MSDSEYFSNVWIAFLTDNVARDVIKRSLRNCPGCKAKLGSPLLHLHEQDSLLRKLETHFDESQGFLLKNLDKLYDQFKDHLQHSDDLKKDRELYINTGRHFLLHSTSHSIIYGLYVNPYTDPVVKQGYSKTSKNKMSRKKVDDDCELLERLFNEVTSKTETTA